MYCSNFAPSSFLLVGVGAIFVGVMLGGPAFSAISATGDVLPPYPMAAPDPWNFETELLVGDMANGILLIEGGSDVASIGSIVGGDPEITGLITVTGEESTWINGGNLYLGLFGNGTLNVLGGATVDTGRASLGHGTGSALAIINGLGSQWSNPDQLVVGNGGEAVLRIQDQGRLMSGDTVIGVNTDSHGSVFLEGQGSVWEVFQSLSLGNVQGGGGGAVSIAAGGNRLFLGAAAVQHADEIPAGETALVVSEVGGVASLEIHGGSQFHNAGSGYIAYGEEEAGTVSIFGSGSRWNNEGDVSIGAGGPGLLIVSNGGQFSTSGTLTLSSEGTLQGDGTATGDVVNAGTVSPGHPVGGLSIAGDYAQNNAGTLAIELSGTASGQFDHLDVTGAASIDGTLEIKLGHMDGVPYVPQLGDSFDIMSATEGLTGRFSSLELPSLSAGQMWLLGYSDELATLSVTASGLLTGDYNRNGLVDVADYVVWRKALVTGNPIADGNGDGSVDADDYGIWKAAYGRSSTSSSMGAVSLAVPEPTSIPVVAWVVFFLASRRRVG